MRSDSPRLYLIRGYLDQAPKDANVIDRVEIAASGEPSRQLLVTSYRSPGVLLDYRSREPMLPYHVIGNRAYVFRLLEAPRGTQIEGTFAIYAQAVPSLLIVSLDIPSSDPTSNPGERAQARSRDPAPWGAQGPKDVDPS